MRVLRDERGEPWWVAADVCKILGMANPTMAMRRLSDDERRGLILNEGLIDQGFSGTTPGTLLNLVNEPGLYSLILRSRKPEAEPFRRWVTHEVLPEIRKTGRYAVPSGASPVAIRLPVGITWTKVASAHRTFFRIAGDLGLCGQQWCTAVHRAVARTCGVDISGLFAPLPDSPVAGPFAKAAGGQPFHELRTARVMRIGPGYGFEKHVQCGCRTRIDQIAIKTRRHSQQITDNPAVMRGHIGPILGIIQIGIGHQISDKLAIAEYGIYRVAEESRFATDMSDFCSVGIPIGADAEPGRFP